MNHIYELKELFVCMTLIIFIGTAIGLHVADDQRQDNAYEKVSRISHSVGEP